MGSENMQKIKGYGAGERAVIGRLKRQGGSFSSIGDILLCDGVLSARDISLMSDEIVGVVAVGERADAVAFAAMAQGISALFVSQEDADRLSEGERAVIYPERDTLFIAPKIEIVDDLSSRMRAEMASAPNESARLFDCREFSSGKVGMKAIVADNVSQDEEGAFAVYKQAAEECALERLVILIDTADLDGIESIRTQMRGAIRAAVYTKLVLVISARSMKEYEHISQLVKGLSKELKDAGGEIPERISQGVWIRDAKGAVCVEEYSRAAELAAVDIDALLEGSCEEEQECVLEGYLSVVSDKMSWRVRDVVLLGRKQTLEKCAQVISREAGEGKRCYFLMEMENIK